MKKSDLWIALYVLVSGIVMALVMMDLRAQETVTLTAPIVRPAITDYQLRALHLDLGDRDTTADDSVIVELESPAATPGDPAKVVRFTYTGPTANTMIVNLNKANLATRSLTQRIFDRLIADGLITGTVTGTVR
jgi:hypothetical protein